MTPLQKTRTIPLKSKQGSGYFSPSSQRLQLCNDLLLGTSPLNGICISCQAQKERRWINHCLPHNGLIWPSSSPAGTGLFFVDKKEKTLWPCIYYRGINDIIIKNWCLCLISLLLSDMLNDLVFIYWEDMLIVSPDKWQPHPAHLTSPLVTVGKSDITWSPRNMTSTPLPSPSWDLSFPDYIQVDPDKVSAVANWQTPTSRKMLQPFLGFPNFYWQLSTLTLHLTLCLLKG